MSNNAAASCKDHFDDLLRRILDLLPGDDALQTCVLGTRWRDIWRCTTSLRFVYDDWSDVSCERFERLVKLIIQLRGNSPLTSCEINPFTDDRPGYTTFRNSKKLIKYALQCRVKRLDIGAGSAEDVPLPLKDRLISRYLRTLEFYYVDFEGLSMDFSGCPVLEELTITYCNVYTDSISSESLKRLCFIEFCSFPDDDRIRIYAPRLISLQLGCLEGFHGLTPLLQDMPLLETAFVTIEDICSDSCESNREDFDDPSCACCDDESVLLNGLSNAVHLELIAGPGKFIYRWDLAWCPIFGRLKTLILNEWFTAIDLVCILQHTPVLKKLTLELKNIKNFVGATRSQVTRVQSVVCARRLVVKIKCRKVDQGVRKILKILRKCGILDKKIRIKERPMY